MLQASLSAKSGLIGRAATTAAAAASDGSKVCQDVTATAVRVFKYLVPEYYEDFKTAAYKWAHDEFLSSLPAAATPTLAPEGLPAAAAPTLAEPGHTPPQAWKAGSWKALQVLYTKHVVPDELIKLWTLDNHINGAERKSVEMQRAEFVLKNLLRGDAHPTLSRFFTFRICADSMTTMDLLNFPLQGFQVKATARERTQARIKKVRTFFGKPLASQVLRRASLVLQLTSAVEAYISKEPNLDKGEPPKLVELLKLKAHVIINEKLQHLLENLCNDPDLDQLGAVTALLATAADLVARLNLYLNDTCGFSRMCKKWFPQSHQHYITLFLNEADENLDTGFCLPLQKLPFPWVMHMNKELFCCLMRCRTSWKMPPTHCSRTLFLLSEWQQLLKKESPSTSASSATCPEICCAGNSTYGERTIVNFLTMPLSV